LTRLLVVSEQLWPEGGGGNLATNLILKLLAECDIDITVVAGTRNPSRTINVKYVFQPLLGFSDKPRLWTSLARPSFRSWFKPLIRRTDVVYIPRYCYPLVPLVKDLGKKVVLHLHDYLPISYNAAVLHNIRIEGFPDNLKSEVLFELSEHASFSRALLGTLLTPFSRLARACTVQADEIMCVSKRQAQIVGRKAPELAEKITVVYNPLPEIPNLEKNIDGDSFLYVGGSSFIKGAYTLAEASRKLLKRRRAKFILTKMSQTKFKSLFTDLNRHFNGAYSLFERLDNHDEVFKLHQRSKALVFPSIWEEPLPYAVIESMLVGTIPIASRVGGVPEIVGGTFAERMLFEPGNVDELVSRMEWLLSLSGQELLETGLTLRQGTLEKFDQEVLKKHLVCVFSA